MYFYVLFVLYPDGYEYPAKVSLSSSELYKLVPSYEYDFDKNCRCRCRIFEFSSDTGMGV